jgi:hypothetical protein
VYGLIAPVAVAVQLAVVSLELVPSLNRDVGEIDTDIFVRVTVTDTSTVEVAAALSVTVQRIVAARVSPAVIVEPTKVVAAALALVMVIASPDTFVQA